MYEILQIEPSERGCNNARQINGEWYEWQLVDRATSEQEAYAVVINWRKMYPQTMFTFVKKR